MVEPSESTVEGSQQLTPELAIANLQSSDLSLRYYAAWWLGKFRVNRPEAVELLLTALEDEDDKTELVVTLYAVMQPEHWGNWVTYEPSGIN